MHSRDEHLLYTNHRSSARPSQRGNHWRDRGSFSTEKVDDSGPEVSQLFAQYEIASEAKETVVHTNHHEQTPKAQQDFLERVDKLFQVFTDMGNPSKEESRDLLSLDTHSSISTNQSRKLELTFSDRNYAVWTLQSKRS